ncbi:TetR/AcrR family transcriptional regulator [Nocardia sp. NPDC052278]|uniref:TetR/AcrR family transcriptional regulator n=1 Tax=unclassified Nocardia TaxID=2637762 RepID=UPI003680D1BA
MSVVANRKVEQGITTRSELVRAAIDLFAERGFADTFTSEVVARAQVTRGALYHHFADKDGLFLAAYEATEEEVAQRLIAAAETADGPDTRIRAGAAAFLDACMDPRIQRILLMDGPSVLGWDRWRRADDPRCARGLLSIGLSNAVAAGILADQPVAPLAELLYGALVQAGLAIARAEDPPVTRRLMGEAVDRLLSTLLVPGPQRFVR